ncbi:AbrB family transcriptional regulator [Nocardia sp. NPDC003963]
MSILRPALPWTILITGTAVGWAALTAAHLAAAGMFAGLVVAAMCALRGVGPAAVPRKLGQSAQAVLAVGVGLQLDTATLSALGTRWIPAVGACASTLLVSILAGFLLGRHRELDTFTGVLAMIAGGAHGLVAVSREMGGDDRVVAAVQYLRVALIIVTLPLVSALMLEPASHDSSPTPPIHPPWYITAAVILGCLAIGVAVARLTGLPAPATLGPLFAAGCVGLTGAIDGITVPRVLLLIAFAVIGWQAGLAFTWASVRAIAQILPSALALIAIVGAACAGLGLLLSRATGLRPIEGYLATTPGGLSAVLAVSAESGSDIAFIAAVQIIRLITVLAVVPILARVWNRRRGRMSRRLSATRTDST